MGERPQVPQSSGVSADDFDGETDAVCGGFGGKVALVIGGSRGIGEAIVSILCDRGATVVVASRERSRAEEAFNVLVDDPTAAVHWMKCDVADSQAIESLVAAVVERFGCLDILINNAATSAHLGPMLDASADDWDRTFAVNVRAPFIAAKAAFKLSMQERGGIIVNVASVGGLRPGRDVGIYNTTKSALIMFTRQLAGEVASFGVRVNAVAPGLVQTQLSRALWGDDTRLERVLATNPMGRLGTAEEVASAVVFLASEDAGYVNGETLVIDGGGGEYS